VRLLDGETWKETDEREMNDGDLEGEAKTDDKSLYSP